MLLWLLLTAYSSGVKLNYNKTIHSDVMSDFTDYNISKLLWLHQLKKSLLPLCCIQAQQSAIKNETFPANHYTCMKHIELLISMANAIKHNIHCDVICKQLTLFTALISAPCLIKISTVAL